MYLTIMKPQAIPQIAVLARGLWVVEGPDGPVLVVKTVKEYILAAQQRRELKLYLAPYKADETRGLTLLTACFDDPQSPLLIKTALIPSDPLTDALQSLPDEFYVCFFDEHNRELFGAKAQAKLGQLRRDLSTLTPVGMDHWPKMYEQADMWFSLTTHADDARALTVFLQEDLFPSDYLITDMTSQDFRGSRGYSNFKLERAEPGTFQELDIVYLLQRAYPSERIVHGPLKVSDGEELADLVVMGNEVTLLLQAKDSPNTPAILNTKLERKRKKAASQLKDGLQQLRGAISTIRRETNPALKLVDGTPLDIDLSARPLVGVVVVKELFIDNYEEYTAMILQFMDEVGVRVLAFDYNEFEVMTRHCPSEDELLSAFFQISKCAEEKRIYPRLRFTDLPPH
ncbi:hypothetical protein V2K54_13335 [Pseudomonas alliivorans]|nr:hypothetical protein [Pseudomonas alliivorans]MEE4965747.1 hypothetical protein [Pseudomonas alliivorans]MEE4988003.1 hypothetical protein [Pseudomonas alliivorans]MEE4992479.1 hypothetical protein [Pseudomonas alliivorans]MEE5008643.1 hypothetical protein [Pseudomonas alliivorans]